MVNYEEEISRTVCVTNLSEQTPEDEIVALFENTAEIVRVRCFPAGDGKKFALLEFRDPQGDLAVQFVQCGGSLCRIEPATTCCISQQEALIGGTGTIPQPSAPSAPSAPPAPAPSAGPNTHTEDEALYPPLTTSALGASGFPEPPEIAVGVSSTSPPAPSHGSRESRGLVQDSLDKAGTTIETLGEREGMRNFAEKANNALQGVSDSVGHVMERTNALKSVGWIARFSQWMEATGKSVTEKWENTGIPKSLENFGKSVNKTLSGGNLERVGSVKQGQKNHL